MNLIYKYLQEISELVLKDSVDIRETLQSNLNCGLFFIFRRIISKG